MVHQGAGSQNIVDISVPLAPWTPVWPGDPPLELEQITSISKGAGYNLTRISMSTHLGTHVDAPRHVLDQGNTVDQIPLDVLVGPATVVQVTARHSIEMRDLESCPLSPRVLFRTRNSDIRQQGKVAGPEGKDGVLSSDYVALSEEAAAYLVASGVKLVGVDGPSVDLAENTSLPVHQILLGASLAVIEWLDLRIVEPGEWTLCCLPLRLINGDGAPARAILMR